VIAAGGGGEPGACDACLRRLALVGLLTPFIERAATGEPGRRSPQLLALGDEDLARAVAPRRAQEVLAEATGRDPASERERIHAAGCWAVCRHDPRYPPGLSDLGDAPPALVGRGHPAGLERLRPGAAVTVVGARKATAYGREVARALAAELATAGFSVVSGLAWGIDGSAHAGALRTGFTVAVLGCGADVAYPRHHRRLYEQVHEHGLVLSELTPGTEAWRWAFPARNRIMAALGAMTVVVEAARRSGSLITSSLAMELGREVGAVPGPVGARMSVGTNDLIADGAMLVRDAQDVLDALVGPGTLRRRPTGPALEPSLAAVLERVEQGGGADAISSGLGLDAGEAAARLARLELLGYLRRSFSGRYERTGLPLPDPPPA
jgi:DNA processing protein